MSGVICEVVMEFQEQLREYENRSTALIEESPQMDEQNTRRKIIEPLIEVLGWDILSSEVELEYSVQMGSGTKKVDYALKLEGAPVVFIEAKGCDSDISEGHTNQLKSYMRQVGVDWGMLSNGRKFVIYRRDKTTNRPSEISLADFPLAKVGNSGNLLRALSRRSIETGESERIADNIEAIQSAAAKLKDNKEYIAERITQNVTGEVGEAVSQIVEDQSKKFVDNLISALNTRIHSVELRVISQEKSKSSNVNYVINVVNNGSRLEQFVGENQTEAMVEAVEWFITEYDLLEEIEVPYIPGTGQGSRALINDQPYHIDGQKMRQFSEIENGAYIFTNLSSDDKTRYISELANKVQLDCEFGGGWRP